MAYPSPVTNDNSIPFGSRTETLYDASGTQIGVFVLEDINLTFPTKRIDRANQVGEPNGFVIVKGQPTGTAVIQIPADATIPILGGYFVDAFPDVYKAHGGSSYSQQWVIESVGAAYEQNGYRKFNVGLVQTLYSGYS